MFHRMPLISATAVVTTALLILVGVLLALSFSPPGTAHAQTPKDPPMVSIESVEPSDVVEEGSSVRVTLRLSRPLDSDDDDRAMCYHGVSENDQEEVEI